MQLDTRIGWWVIGCLVGFVAGYIVRSLREIRDKVEEVDKHVIQQQSKDADDEGFASNSVMTNIALALVVILTAWAAFSSQQSSNKVQDNQDSIARVSDCTRSYLTKTLAALNARTEFTQEQAVANVNLQKAQAKFLTVALLHNPPVTQQQATAALQDYFGTLTAFITASGKTSNAIDQNPYPTDVELKDCLEGKTSK